MKLVLTDGQLKMKEYDEELFLTILLTVSLDYDFLMRGSMVVAETMFNNFYRISENWEDSDLVTLTDDEEEDSFGIEAHVVTSAGQEVKGGQLAEAIGYLLIWAAEHYFPENEVTVKELIEFLIDKNRGDLNETL